MAIQWADSFSRYGLSSASLSAMRDGLPYNNWESAVFADPDPVAAAAGGRALQCYAGFNNNPLASSRIALPTPTTGTVGICSRYWMNNFGSGAGRAVVAVFTTVALAPLAYVVVEPNGSLTFLRGNLAQISTTTSPVISTNTWNHIETTYNGTTGAMAVRVNGIQVLTGVSADTGTTAFAMPMQRISSTIEVTMWLKDFVIWDSSGSQNNTYLGSVIVRRQATATDVTLGSWVPSTGTSGTAILNKTAVNDATYLSAAVPPSTPMRFTLDNLPSDVTSVKGVVTVIRAQKIDGGDANLQTSLISNGDVDPGADRPITTAFSYWYDISELDPDTSAPWTPAGFNAAEADVDRTV